MSKTIKQMEREHNRWLRFINQPCFPHCRAETKAQRRAWAKQLVNAFAKGPWKGSSVDYDGDTMILRHPSGGVARINLEAAQRIARTGE